MVSVQKGLSVDCEPGTVIGPGSSVESETQSVPIKRMVGGSD